MIIEELLYQQPPVHTARLTAQQSREQSDRNAANLLRWYTDERTFGPVVGRVLAGEVRT